MNRSNGREIQLDRIRRARCFADYTQETMAEAMKPLLGKFSYKTYRAIETGTRAFRFDPSVTSGYTRTTVRRLEDVMRSLRYD